jgi:hypothetical protein
MDRVGGVFVKTMDQESVVFIKVIVLSMLRTATLHAAVSHDLPITVTVVKIARRIEQRLNHANVHTDKYTGRLPNAQKKPS